MVASVRMRMNEAAFLDRIDGRFPYADLEAGLRLADEACAISANAGFALVDELARPPLGAMAPAVERLAVLDRVAARLEHPLAPAVLGLARRWIQGEEPSVDEAVALMRSIEAFPGQHAALSLAFLCCDDPTDEAAREYQRIQRAWGTE